jgi:flavin reductase (DIM6/NTAB) family NADH-FMN oxidoreductase RutF
MECRVEKIIECGDHNLVVGEVLKVGVRKDAIKDGLLNVELVKPLLHLGGKDFVVGDHRKNVDE